MKKTSSKSKLQTSARWAIELRHDRGVLTKALDRVKHDGKRGKFKLYALSTVKAALVAHDASKRQKRGVSDDLLREKIRAIELRNAISDGTLIEHDKVKSAISVLLARVDQLIEQKLVNEFPASVAGLDPSQARVFGKRLTDDLLAEFATCRKAFSI